MSADDHLGRRRQVRVGHDDFVVKARALRGGHEALELVELCPVHLRFLAVLRGRKSQMQCGAIRDELTRQEEATIDVGAVRSDGIDLIDAVCGPDVTGRSEATPDESYDHDIAHALSPLALNAQQLSADLEDQVVSPVLEQRTEDLDTQPRCVEHDGGLSDIPLAIAIQRIAGGLIHDPR